MDKEFQEKSVDQAFAELLEKISSEDLKQIKLPKEVLSQIQLLTKIREELEPSKIDSYLVPHLINRQAMIAGSKYLISRHLAIMKASQSYAFVYRKFKTASEWNKTKERLGIGKSKQPTVNEIEGEIEQDLVNVRKTEIAYQTAGDKLECLLTWCQDMIMIIQNKIRNADTDQRSTYASNNPQIQR